jgi:hypothetical protein
LSKFGCSASAPIVDNATTLAGFARARAARSGVDEAHGFRKVRRRVEHWRHHRENTGCVGECRCERLRIRQIGESDIAAQLCPGDTPAAIPDYRLRIPNLFLDPDRLPAASIRMKTDPEQKPNIERTTAGQKAVSFSNLGRTQAKRAKTEHVLGR